MGAPLPRRASSREAAETWDGQTSKGQSEEEDRSPFRRCFLQTRKSQCESHQDQAQKSLSARPGVGRLGAGIPTDTLPLLTRPRLLCFCGECGCFSRLLSFQGSPLTGQAHLGRSQDPGGPGTPVFAECLLKRSCGSLSRTSLPRTQHGAVRAEAQAAATPQDPGRWPGQELDSGRSVSQPGPSAGPWEALGVSPLGSRH